MHVCVCFSGYIYMPYLHRIQMHQPPKQRCDKARSVSYWLCRLSILLHSGNDSIEGSQGGKTQLNAKGGGTGVDFCLSE